MINFLLLFLLFNCFTFLAAQNVDPSEVDCNNQPGFCGQYGSCKPDGICGCQRGFRGATCSLLPPHLEKGWKIPGQVSEDSPEAFYSINPDEFGTTTEIEVIVVGGGKPINLYASIGIMPTREISQWEFTKSQKINFLIDSTDLAPNAFPESIKVLYIVIQSADDPNSLIPFSITHKGGGIVGGLENWQFGLIVGGGICCCCCIIIVIIVLLMRGGGDSKQNNQQQDANSVVMQPGYGNQQAALSNDYPSADPNAGANAPMNSYGGSVANSYPSSMDNPYAGGTGTASELGRPSGMYDNMGGSSVGGYTPAQTEGSQFGRPGNMGGGDMVMGGYGNGMQGDMGMGMGGGDMGMGMGMQGGGGGDWGAGNMNMQPGYSMDDNTQALW